MLSGVLKSIYASIYFKNVVTSATILKNIMSHKNKTLFWSFERDPFDSTVLERTFKVSTAMLFLYREHAAY